MKQLGVKNGRVKLPKNVIDKYNLNESETFYLKEAPYGLILLRPTNDLKRVYLEITNRCNLACSICIRNTWQEPMGDMDWKTFSTLIEQFADLKQLEAVQIAGYGEPFVHTGICQMITSLCQLEVEVELVTNGLLLNENNIDQLISAGVKKIIVSIDSLETEEYKQIRIGGGLPQVLANLQLLRRMKRSRNSLYPRVGVAFVAMKSNYHQLSHLMNLPVEYGVSFIVVTNFLPYTANMRDEILYDRSNDDFAKMSGWFSPSTKWPQMRLKAPRLCSFIANHSVAISWQGNVSPCYPLLHSSTVYLYGREKKIQRHSFGNALQQSLAAIWTGAEYVAFRHQVKSFDFPSCADCDFNDGCDMVQTNVVDCWENSPSCADCLWAWGIIQCP
jgi:tungsten cofactor oxidoreducase radical SAM maturase